LKRKYCIEKLYCNGEILGSLEFIFTVHFKRVWITIQSDRFMYESCCQTVNGLQDLNRLEMEDCSEWGSWIVTAKRSCRVIALKLILSLFVGVDSHKLYHCIPI
jgi:hypothetical protein